MLNRISPMMISKKTRSRAPASNPSIHTEHGGGGVETRWIAKLRRKRRAHARNTAWNAAKREILLESHTCNHNIHSNQCNHSLNLRSRLAILMRLEKELITQLLKPQHSLKINVTN